MQDWEYAEKYSVQEKRARTPAKEKVFWVKHKISPVDEVLVLVICLGRVLLHCYYSQVHSDPEWKYLLGSHIWIKLISFKIIHIR